MRSWEHERIISARGRWHDANGAAELRNAFWGLLKKAPDARQDSRVGLEVFREMFNERARCELRSASAREYGVDVGGAHVPILEDLH